MYTWAIHMYILKSERAVAEVKVKYMVIYTYNKNRHEKLRRKH